MQAPSALRFNTPVVGFNNTKQSFITTTTRLLIS
jgi:hypothetical protein